MPIFFLPPHAITPPSVTVPPDLLPHLRDSLRIEAGERVVFADGQGHRYRTEITQSSKHGVSARILETWQEPTDRPPAIVLGQAVLKGEKMDWVIQKATELGVRRIIPIQSRHTVVQLRPERLESQLTRWQRIALEAAQQSEQWRVPAVDPPQSLKEFVQQPADHSLRLFLAERTGQQSLRTLPLPSAPDTEVIVLVGPEGGWSEEELRLADQAGWLPVTLGPSILRAETAAVVTVGVLQHQLGALG